MSIDQLEKEIQNKSKEIVTDSYMMSIGELSNLYRDTELDINPEFQRYFRWDMEQKSKFIESILMGLPLPTIFVSQREDGIWDLIDGLQRLSTIFEFMGELKDADGTLKEQSRLQGTEFLPSLENCVWDKSEDHETELPRSLKIKIKRSKMTVNIIKIKEGSDTHFELFQRLNTGGSELTPQEIRNVVIMMESRSFFNSLEELSKDENFIEAISLTDSKNNESYDMELVTRFIVYRNIPLEEYKSNTDINLMLTKEIVNVISKVDMEEEIKIFKETFELLNDKLRLKSDSFRKFDKEQGKFTRGFLLSAYEVIAIGISKNLEKARVFSNQEKIKEKIKNIYYSAEFLDATKKGTRSIERAKKLVSYGENIFSKL